MNVGAMNKSYLDYFCETICEFSQGKCAKESCIYEYVGGLPERPDKILAQGCVYGCFSSDCRVNHSKE